MTGTMFNDLKVQLAYERILPRLNAQFKDKLHTNEWKHFKARLERVFPTLFWNMWDLYWRNWDFFHYIESIVEMCATVWLERPAHLRKLDLEREKVDACRFNDRKHIAAVCYVDLFAGDLQKMKDKIWYLKELGITFLHLMPLFKCPEEENDGGYAVSDYRAVDPKLGTMDDLRDLVKVLADNGISVMLDFVFNHTSDEHKWAKAALSGDGYYQGFYYFFPHREIPDRFDQTLREIFPTVRRGCFSHRPEVDQWVWSTFHNYQFDLNYSNPAVFREMAAEMCFLANVGIDVLRLDALAFSWKEEGTKCESLPTCHALVRAFNSVCRLAAPSLQFLSEAIVHPDEVNSFIHLNECQMSYNPLLMALEWESMATKRATVMRKSMSYRFSIPPGCVWMNYVRSHDDIGWTFDDEDARQSGVYFPADHRWWLNAFYNGRVDYSFSKGLPFSENPTTGDARVTGTCASLAGLEAALDSHDDIAKRIAIDRIALLYGVAMSMAGIPLIYLGDELGQLNDYTFKNDPEKAGDSRWVHRVRTSWEKVDRRNDSNTIEGKVYQRFQRLIWARSNTEALSGSRTDVIHVSNHQIFCCIRGDGSKYIICLFNFNDNHQEVSCNELKSCVQEATYHNFQDILYPEKRNTITLDRNLVLEPYEQLWLRPL